MVLDVCSDPNDGPDYGQCPIPGTHRRLTEAQLLWHQALVNYHEPAAFHANLNAAIQALRNITFVLQSEKHSFPDFDRWYAVWRSKLGADPIAKWIILARNTIVKQGDLETTSTATVSLLTYRNEILTELVVPADAPTDLLVSNVSLLGALDGSRLPPEAFRDAALAIERRWSVAELQGEEILDSLARVYGQLSAVVFDAHKAFRQFDCIPAPCSHPDFVATHDSKGVLGCMAVGREQRTQLVALSSGVHYQPVIESSGTTKEDLETAAVRYRLADESVIPQWQGTDPVLLAQRLLYRAKRLLQKDKTLVRTVFVRDSHGTWHQTVLHTRDRIEKYILMRVLASLIERIGGDALIDIAESWFVPLNSAQEMYTVDVEHHRGRKEGIQVLVATRDGVLRVYVTSFSRGPFGGITFGATDEVQGPGPYYLSPVLDVWRPSEASAGANGIRCRQLWQPDPLDMCFCGGQKRFSECCQPILKDLEQWDATGGETARLIEQGQLPLAEQLARAAVARYVIWVREHTAPMRHLAQELHKKLVEIDVPALEYVIQTLGEVLVSGGRSSEFLQGLRRLSMIVGVPEIAVRLTALAVQHLLNSGDVAAAAAELKGLGSLEQINDSLALVLATQILELPGGRVEELLSRAGHTGLNETENARATLKLARHFFTSGYGSRGLQLVDSIISGQLSEAVGLPVTADALCLRWDITEDEADFHAAKAALLTLPSEQAWSRLASILIDHGEYDEAMEVLATPLQQGEVIAHLLTIDVHLRRGSVCSAREVLLEIPSERVRGRVLFPYAYTTGLVALACHDPALIQLAVAGLRKIRTSETPMSKAADEMLAVLRDPTVSSHGSAINRLRDFVRRMRLSF